MQLLFSHLLFVLFANNRNHYCALAFIFLLREQGEKEYKEQMQFLFSHLLFVLFANILKLNNYFLLSSVNHFKMEINKLTGIVVDLRVKIHSRIGPGCFERVYEEILYYELNKLYIKVHRQLFLPIQYEELQIENAYKLDLLVENKLVLELKSVSPLPSVYFKQLKTQLGLLNLKHGMILNFKVDLMKEGIHRVYNNFGEEES